jgi:hypothetical protein
MMVASILSVSSDLKGDLTDTLAKDAVFSQINKIWNRLRKQGLEDRHRTGVLLNEKFGAPGSRQAYGKKMLKAYSASLGISVSELSRMRGFATRFVSVQDMKTQHPDVKTWTQAKKLLVSTTKDETQTAEPTKGNDQPKPAETKNVSRAIQAIQAVRQCISEVQLAPNGDDRTALDQAVKGMLADIEKFLGVRYLPENPFPAVIYSPLDDGIRHAPVALAS